MRRALTALLIVGIVAVAAGTASANPVTGSDANGTYLALGDSVAFGYVPSDATPAPSYDDPHSFVGYPEYLAQMLGERVSNASCPGETSTSMLVPGAQSNGCENSPTSPVGYRTLYPLHVQYQGTQMAYALHYLAAHRHTRLVTIDVGANDGFLCQETTPDSCRSELGGILSQVAANLTTIFHELRGTGYGGPIVVLTYYSLSYTDPVQLYTTGLLDSAIAAATRANHGVVADGFGAFYKASLGADGDPCTAGLLIPVPGGCNIHPSPLGQQVLAGAIATALRG